MNKCHGCGAAIATDHDVTVSGRCFHVSCVPSDVVASVAEERRREIEHLRNREGKLVRIIQRAIGEFQSVGLPHNAGKLEEDLEEWENA